MSKILVLGREFSFVSGFLRGLSAPAEIYNPLKIKNKYSSIKIMRSDWEAIGGDFRKVISQENGKTSESKAA